MYIEAAKTVNEMTLNELVKLTTLWTTGPSFASFMCSLFPRTTLIDFSFMKDLIQLRFYGPVNPVGHVQQVSLPLFYWAGFVF